MVTKVLVVDDSKALVQSSCDLLSTAGYKVHGATDVPKAIAEFRDFQPDVCLVDYHMPQMLGGDLAKLFKKKDASVEIIFLTGEGEAQLAVELMREGAVDCLIKPVDMVSLRAALDRALDHQRVVQLDLAYRTHLETMVAQQRQALNDSVRKLEHLSTATLEALGLALDFRDQDTSGHLKRVTACTSAIARQIGISGAPLLTVEQGAFLHDIGELRISDSILLKPGPLTAAEWETMRMHPQYGREFLSQFDFLAEAADIVYTHHEKFDGSGYPRGLRAEKIPIGSRIFAVVDAIDAMTQSRLYHRPIPMDQAMEEVKRCSGQHFDPEIARFALACPELTGAAG